MISVPAVVAVQQSHSWIDGMDISALAFLALALLLAVPAYKCAISVLAWWVGRNTHRIGD